MLLLRLLSLLCQVALGAAGRSKRLGINAQAPPLLLPVLLLLPPALSRRVQNVVWQHREGVLQRPARLKRLGFCAQVLLLQLLP